MSKSKCEGNGIHDTGGIHSYMEGGVRRSTCYYCGKPCEAEKHTFTTDIGTFPAEAYAAPKKKPSEFDDGYRMGARHLKERIELMFEQMMNTLDEQHDAHGSD